MKTVYFVISLPRTGTKSICRMAHECGFKIKHAPVNTFESRFNEGHNFFADTPCFVPSFVENICQRDDINPRFIFIEKNHEMTFQSWRKVNLHLNYSRMYNQYMNEETRSQMKKSTMTDFMSLHESFSQTFMDESNYSELFESHKQKVLSIVKKYNKDLLEYSFTDQWEPFCNFVGCDIPEIEIPHLNIDTMFQPIL